MVANHGQPGRTTFLDEVEPVEDHVVLDRVPRVVARVGDRAAADVEGGVLVERGAPQFRREQRLELERRVIKRPADAAGRGAPGLPRLADAEALLFGLLL